MEAGRPSAAAAAAALTRPQEAKTCMTYLCGGTLTPLLALVTWIDCGAENEIKPKDAIRCRECGYRIMYKKRTKRSIISSISPRSMLIHSYSHPV